MQTFWKHREVLFNKEYKALGWVGFPNILLFQFIIPAFAPVADIFMLIRYANRQCRAYTTLLWIVHAG